MEEEVAFAQEDTLRVSTVSHRVEGRQEEVLS